MFWQGYMKLNDAGYFITKQGRRGKRSRSTMTDDDTADDKIDYGVWLHIVGSVH